jgi:hypothetical protein
MPEAVHDVWLTGRAVQYAGQEVRGGIQARQEHVAWPCSYEATDQFGSKYSFGSP